MVVASGAGGRVAMLVEQLSDGGGSANVGLDGRHVGRRWRGRFAEDALEHPLAAQHG